MKSFGLLLTSLAACAQATPADDAAVFHGSVGRSITHVMAVSPVAGDLEKVIAPTAADGSFSIEVEAGRPWALVFVDAGQRGPDMVRGVLRADTLDTFTPRAGGDIDLGHVSIDNREATMAGSSESLDAALGLSRRTLATIGGLDDLALRYANPDIDTDGLLDVEQGIAPRLEIHAEYALRAGNRAASVDDLLAGTQLGYQHVGTGIYTRLPDEFGPVDRDDADVTFEMPYYGYWAGALTLPVPAGQPIDKLTFGDARTFGVFCRPDAPIPAGDYLFRTRHLTMQFTLVRPPSEMTMHQVMPRLKLVPVDPACTKNCELDAIEFAWQRRTDGAWLQLTDEEAQALKPAGTFDVVFTDGEARRYEFPVGTPTGSVPWDLDLRSARPQYRTDHIEFANITFQSRGGMRMAARLGDDSKAPRAIDVPDQLIGRNE